VVLDTTPQLGGNLDLNAFNIVFNPSPASASSWTGIIESRTCGEAVGFTHTCYLKSDGKMWKTDANAAATSKGLIRMALGTYSAESTGVFLVIGYVRADAVWNWATVGAELFLSTTAGGVSETAPSGNADIWRIVGHVVTADIVYFNPSQEYTEVTA
jgi:hypothetical protein